MAKTVKSYMSSNGFEQYNTGGGCMAYRGEVGEFTVLITKDNDGCSMPETFLEPVLVGFYLKDDEADEGTTVLFRSVGEFIAHKERTYRDVKEARKAK